jgi:hypothetical protein
LANCPFYTKTIFGIVIHGGEFSITHKDDMDNHANQINHNNDAYWESRGYDERPDDWEDREE